MSGRHRRKDDQVQNPPGTIASGDFDPSGSIGRDGRRRPKGLVSLNPKPPVPVEDPGAPPTDFSG